LILLLITSCGENKKPEATGTEKQDTGSVTQEKMSAPKLFYHNYDENTGIETPEPVGLVIA